MPTKPKRNYLATSGLRREKKRRSARPLGIPATQDVKRGGGEPSSLIGGRKTSHSSSFMQTGSQYRQMVETMSEAGLIVSAAGRILYANRRLALNLGVRAEKIVGRSIFDFAHGPDQNRLKLLLRHALRKPDNARIRLMKSTGTALPLHLWASPLRQHRESTVSIVATDLTQLEADAEMFFRLKEQRKELEQAQQELEESRQEYADLYDLAPLGHITLDRRGIITAANQTAVRFLGLDRSSLINRHLLPIVCPADRRKFLAHLNHLKRGELQAITEITLSPRGQPELPVQLISNCSVSSSGEGVRYFTAIIDLTERRKVEARLQEHEVHLHAALEAAELGEWDFDLKSRMLHRSARHAHIFGYLDQGEDWTEEVFLAHIVPEDRHLVTESLKQSLEIRHPWEFECRIFRADRVQRWVWVRGRLEYDPGGKPTRYRGFIRDVTERKKSDARTEHLASFPRLNPNPVLELNLAGGLIYANNAAASALSELGAGSDGRAFLPADIKALLNETARSDTTRVISREVRIKDRTYIETIFCSRELNVVRIYAVDITKLKRAEEGLQKAHDELERRIEERTEDLKRALRDLRSERQRFNDVLEMMPAYVVLLSPDYHVPFANRYFEQRFGKSNGRRCYEYLFNRTSPCEVCDSYTVLKTNAPHHWEWNGPDGRIYDIHDFPFTDVDGSPLIMEMGIDITEQKRAEDELKKHRENLEVLVDTRTRELRASEERLRAMYQTMTEGLANLELVYENGTPVDYVITVVNPAFERLTGISRETAVGKRATELSSSGGALYLDVFARVAEGGTPENFETYVQPMQKHLAVSVFSPGRGKCAAAFSDITARKKIEEQVQQQIVELRKVNEELERFNRVMIDRESRMIELKKEVNAFCAEAGLEPRYPLKFELEEKL